LRTSRSSRSRSFCRWWGRAPRHSRAWPATPPSSTPGAAARAARRRRRPARARRRWAPAWFPRRSAQSAAAGCGRRAWVRARAAARASGLADRCCADLRTGADWRWTCASARALASRRAPACARAGARRAGPRRSARANPRAARAGPQPAPVGSQVTPASASEPHVQMALRISTDSHESAHVTQELVAGAAPNGELLLRLQGQGMAVSSLRLAAHQLYDVRPRPAPGPSAACAICGWCCRRASRCALIRDACPPRRGTGRGRLRTSA
jgi:hypothetical protein